MRYFEKQSIRKPSLEHLYKADHFARGGLMMSPFAEINVYPRSMKGLNLVDMMDTSALGKYISSRTEKAVDKIVKKL